jgi:hypothetical protein
MKIVQLLASDVHFSVIRRVKDDMQHSHVT